MEVERGAECYCPECGKPLIYKSGYIVQAHFAHYCKSGCWLSEGESIRHMQMKLQMGAIFKRFGFQFQYECRLLPDQCADLALSHRFVVECQCSPLTIEEWDRRTRAYNAKGWPVLWVWDMPRIFGRNIKRFVEFDPNVEYRPAAEIRKCHQWSYGRVYALGSVGEFFACHFDKASERSSEWYERDVGEMSSSYTPKTLKYIQTKDAGRRPWCFRGPEQHRLIQFGEGVWWKE